MGDKSVELQLLEEIQQKIQGRQCDPERCREAELATLARADMSEVRGMSRAQVLVRLGDRARCEGFPCRVRKRGSDVPWRRGLCRRYGVKVFHFVSYEDVDKLKDVKREAARACGEPEFTLPFEEYLEQRIGEVLPIDEFDIINDFEWALGKTGAQIERAEQQLTRTEQHLGRLRSDMKKLGDAYRRLLTSRTGGGRGSQADPAARMKQRRARHKKKD